MHAHTHTRTHTHMDTYTKPSKQPQPVFKISSNQNAAWWLHWGMPTSQEWPPGTELFNSSTYNPYAIQSPDGEEQGWHSKTVKEWCMVRRSSWVLTANNPCMEQGLASSLSLPSAAPMLTRMALERTTMQVRHSCDLGLKHTGTYTQTQRLTVKYTHIPTHTHSYTLTNTGRHTEMRTKRHTHTHTETQWRGMTVSGNAVNLLIAFASCFQHGLLALLQRHLSSWCWSRETGCLECGCVHLWQVNSHNDFLSPNSSVFMWVCDCTNTP